MNVMLHYVTGNLPRDKLTTVSLSKESELILTAIRSHIHLVCPKPKISVVAKVNFFSLAGLGKFFKRLGIDKAKFSRERE